MKLSRWRKYDKKSGLWIPHEKRIYLYWYSFLQRAERDKSKIVYWIYYQDWGGRDVVMNTKFDDWWKQYWKELFGIQKEGDKPKRPLTTKQPKVDAYRYALLVYECGLKGMTNTWEIGKYIAAREKDKRKLQLTSLEFFYATPAELRAKKSPQIRSEHKKKVQRAISKFKKSAEKYIDNVCLGKFP